MGFTTETKRGSDCSGSDGDSNRVLTLSNTVRTQAGGFQVFLNGLSLVLTTEFTVNHLAANTTVTFLNPVWDDGYITVIYNYAGASPSAASYCSTDDVYNVSGLDSDDIGTSVVTELILDAEAELESVTGRKFTNANSVTEYHSMRDKDLVGNFQSTFQTSHWPLQSVTEFKILDQDGDATSTFDTLTASEITANTYSTDDYWLDVSTDSTNLKVIPYGKVTLKTKTFPEGVNNVKIVYTYGYSSVPRMVQQLAAYMSAVRVWIWMLGGNFDSANQYHLGEFQVHKGELYMEGKNNLRMCQERIESLMARIGRKQKTVFFATGGDR